MPERLRVAVVGGGIGINHINGYKSLPEQYELVSICDIDRERAQKIAAEHAIPLVTTDIAELCRMDDLDVIDICTPPHLHFTQVQQVLAAGKHAICEKPLVSSLAEVDELVAAEARSGRRVMPVYQYRYGHGLQKLKFLVEAGLAGQAYLTTVETSWRRRAEYYAVPWRGKWATERGGVLLSHAIHAHDMLCYVVGPIRRVFARATTRVNPIEVEDCASASLEMADGSLASLSATLGSPAEISRHRFCFSNLVAESNTRAYSSSGEPWIFSADTPELEERIAAALERFVPLPEGFRGQYYRFYEALQAGAAPPVTLADARVSIELITALYYSARTGENVELPLGPDHPNYGGWLP